jgi:hypothetical protein
MASPSFFGGTISSIYIYIYFKYYSKNVFFVFQKVCNFGSFPTSILSIMHVMSEKDKESNPHVGRNVKRQR